DCTGFVLFFFQAEDGIRGKLVTGVQTCALPIFASLEATMITSSIPTRRMGRGRGSTLRPAQEPVVIIVASKDASPGLASARRRRSEERRVGKECRGGGGAYHDKKRKDREVEARH